MMDMWVHLRVLLTGSNLWKTSLSTFYQLESFEINLQLSSDPQDLILSSLSSWNIVHSPHPITLPRCPVKQPVSNRNTQKRHTTLLPPRITLIVRFRVTIDPRQPCPSPSSSETAQMHPFCSQSFSKLNIFASPTPLRQKTTFPLAPTWDSHCWRQQTDQEPPWSTLSAKLIIMITLSVKNCRN